MSSRMAGYQHIAGFETRLTDNAANEFPNTSVPNMYPNMCLSDSQIQGPHIQTAGCP